MSSSSHPWANPDPLPDPDRLARGAPEGEASAHRKLVAAAARPAAESDIDMACPACPACPTCPTCPAIAAESGDGVGDDNDDDDDAVRLANVDASA